jgi:flagellar biosynthesis/type III secretory pathway chaperone
MSLEGEALYQLFREEHALLTRLAVLLEQEFDEARSGTVPGDVLVEKQALVAELDRATSRRLDWLEERDLPTHGQSLRDAIPQLDHSGRLFALYTRFESDAMACRERNRRLGQFNLRRQQSLQQALQIFASRSDGESHDYTALGQHEARQAARLLGSA